MEENDFIVTLPSADNLQRVIQYGGLFIKEKKIYLNSEVWSEEQEGLLLPKVYIRILWVPSKLRELPVLWALGSMVGATQMVDMVTSKNSNFCRVLVTVLDSKAIPGQLGVVIGDRWFEFPIEVDSIIHGVESYVEISTYQGDKDDTNDKEMMT